MFCGHQCETAALPSLKNTSKTNRFRIPLVSTTGITNVSITLNFGFASVTDEDSSAYHFAIDALNK